MTEICQELYRHYWKNNQYACSPSDRTTEIKQKVTYLTNPIIGSSYYKVLTVSIYIWYKKSTNAYCASIFSIKIP